MSQTLKHPNIVRLYDVIETDKYIGIILEYASGGELFDHILAHRYLKEKDAAKLFSQLISGVWYIHQKKIVHRDLKLENLLLDRNRNVIITDFGFANRFEHRADDLMQTSCGSPCYAAPELVISEGLYVGSAVDIWSCGVILYAMLAGYLPFDDDPANPDGDNINLLYKYIVNTPLSFPDYVSTEARDLLSMMLVPDPTRRADLRSIMTHPWLSAYVHIFSNAVEDLERAAMEQHQMKRLAYQRQMRQAATAQSEPSRVARTQSARVDGMLNVSSSTAPRSHSYRDNLPAGQPEYLYETSIDQSIYSSSPTAPPSRNAVSLAVTPATSTGPADNDPFAPPSAVNIPVTISLPDEGPSVTPNIQDIDSSYPPIGSAKSPTDAGKKKAASGFRHTIQVEYPGDPHSKEQVPASSHGKVSRAESSSARPSSKQGGASRDRVASHTSPRTPGEKAAVVPTIDVGMSTPKPLPAPPTTPTPSRVDTTHLTPSAALRENQPQTPLVAISPASPSTTNGEDKSSKSVHGSTGSGSSRHRKGLSVDKFGLGKIFGTNGDQAAVNGMRSRVPSESSAAGTPVAEEKKAASTVTGTNDTAKSALLSPVSSTPTDSAKKNRRNTLTVMVEPFSRTIKSRKGKTPVGETPVKDDNRDPEKQLPPSSTDSPSQTNRGTVFPSVAKDGHQTHDMPASTTKARNVMQWFRRRSNAKADGEDSPDLGAIRAGTDLSSRSQIPTPSTKTGLDRNGNQGRSAGAGETSFSFSRAGWKFNASTPPKDVLRIHHGAVDQTTITTRPPPEVIKHVCKVLEEMGMDIKAESEYKYRCVRSKRRKSGGTVGLGFSTVGSGSGLAAFTMVGSAASNGVSHSFCCPKAVHDKDSRSINVVFPFHLIPLREGCSKVFSCEDSHLRFLEWLLRTHRCLLMTRILLRHLRR